MSGSKRESFPPDASLVESSCPPSHSQLKALLTVFGSFLALFGTFGQMISFGTFQAFYADHQLQSRSPSDIAWIGSLQLWLFFFSGCLVGKLFDQYGPRWLLVAGTFCVVLSLMMTSLCRTFFEYILAQGLLFGLGVGLVFYPCVSCITSYRITYNATAMGIALAGSSLGGVMYPIALKALFERIGFEWGVRVSGLISGVCCGIAVLTVTAADRDPLRADGASRVLFDLHFTLLIVGSAFVALGLFTPFFYVTDYAHDVLSLPHRPSLGTVDINYIVLAVLNAGGLVGRIAPAYLSDLLGCFNLIAPCSAICGLLVLLWPLAFSLPSLMAFAALYGFFSGAFISLITPCIKEISKERPIGTRIGMLYGLVSFPALLGGPLAGLIKERVHRYVGLTSFAGASLCVGAVFLCVTRFTIEDKVFKKV